MGAPVRYILWMGCPCGRLCCDLVSCCFCWRNEWRRLLEDAAVAWSSSFWKRRPSCSTAAAADMEDGSNNSNREAVAAVSNMKEFILKVVVVVGLVLRGALNNLWFDGIMNVVDPSAVNCLVGILLLLLLCSELLPGVIDDNGAVVAKEFNSSFILIFCPLVLIFFALLGARGSASFLKSIACSKGFMCQCRWDDSLPPHLSLLLHQKANANDFCFMSEPEHFSCNSSCQNSESDTRRRRYPLVVRTPPNRDSSFIGTRGKMRFWLRWNFANHAAASSPK